MTMRPRIAIDAMGGDEGVPVMLAGAALARHRHEGFQFLLVGDEPTIKTALDKHPNLCAASEILHAEDVVTGDDKMSQAIRKAKTSSMGLAINAVKTGDRSAIYSDYADAYKTLAVTDAVNKSAAAGGAVDPRRLRRGA